MARTLGLDIGNRWVRAVVLDGDRLVAHAAASRRGADGAERPLATVVAELAAGLPAARPVVASSELEALARFLHLAPLPPERLARVLRLELAPEEGEAACADALRLAVEGEDIAFLGVVAPAERVQELLRGLGRASVRPAALAWGPLALAAAAARQVEEGALVLVADVGEQGSDLALVGAGRVLAARRLPLGVQQFIHALVDAGCEPARAEARLAEPLLGPESPFDDADEGETLIVLESGTVTRRRAGADAMPALELPEEPQALREAAALRRAADAYATQLATALAFFRAQLRQRELQPAELWLCGGGSLIPGLAEHLAERLQLPVVRWDPAAGLAGAVPEQPGLWARAIGLALPEPAFSRLDLRPEREAVREAWRGELLWWWVAAAALLVAGIAAAGGLWARAERAARAAEQHAAAVAEQRRLSGELAALEAERDALREDLRAILGRIYAARDLLYTVRALKEQTGEARELWVTELRTFGVGAEPAEAVPAGGAGRLAPGRAAALARRDTLVERGGIELAGRVRFDAKKADTEMVAFIERYQRALAEWRMPDGTPLFRHVVLKNRRTERKDEEFSFRFHCFFPFASVTSEQLAAGGEEPAP